MSNSDEFYILLVDDNKDLVLNISDILKDKGYKVTTTYNGSEALSLVNKNRFDLAIMDLKLPDIFGLDLIEKLSLVSPELEYIVLTGHGKIEDAINAVSSKKIVSFEFKPIDISRLLKMVQEIKRRKKAERDLIETEEKYRNLVENSLVGIYITQNHIIKFCNKKFANIFGYQSADELIGCNIKTTVSNEDWDLVDSEVKKREKGEKKSSRYEFRGIRKDKSTVFLEVLGNRIEYNNEPAIQGTIIDITQRHLAEKKLRILTSAVEQSPLSITITDKNGNITYVNSEFTKLTGYQKSEVIGSNPRILKSGHTSIDEYEKLWKTISSGKIWQGEFKNKKKSGDLYWEKASIGRLLNSNGEIDGYVEVKTDISKEKKYENDLNNYRKNLENMIKERTEKLENMTNILRESEKSLLYLVEDVNSSKKELEVTNKSLNRSFKQLEETKNRIDAILKSLTDGIIVTDLKDEVLLINRYTEYLFGVSSEKIIGKKLDYFIKDKVLLKNLKKVVSASGKDHRFEFEMIPELSKSRKIVEIRVSIVWDSYGIINGLVLLFRDVTYEREIDRMKTEFISTAAHELRTPLTAIRGYSELLMSRDDISGDEKKKFLGYINNQSVRLGKIISDLLDISRIESGKGLPVNKKPSDINKIIIEATDRYKEIYKNHKFVFKLQKKLRKINFDPGLITQVMINLISNAVKYSPDGGVITISSELEGDFLKCSVQDEGIGMSKIEVKKIFNKFYRVDSSDTAVEGSGLGMNIVKNIIDSHNGKITVISSSGKGTEVVFKLPIDKHYLYKTNNFGEKNEKDSNS